MLRFNSSFLTLLDAWSTIIIQTIASSKIGFLLIPSYFLKSFCLAWVVTILWAIFLRALNFKVGFWWVLASSSILIIFSWGWSLLTFFYWDNGPVMLQMMPPVGNVLWSFFLFQVQQVLVVRLHLAAWFKKTLGALLIALWLFLAAASIVEHDLSTTTIIGAALFGYYFFRLTAGLYIRNGKRWQQFFGVDGKI